MSYNKNKNFDAKKHNEEVLELIYDGCLSIQKAMTKISSAKYQSLAGSESEECANKIVGKMYEIYSLSNRFVEMYKQNRIDLFINKD